MGFCHDQQWSHWCCSIYTRESENFFALSDDPIISRHPRNFVNRTAFVVFLEWSHCACAASHFHTFWQEQMVLQGMAEKTKETVIFSCVSALLHEIEAEEDFVLDLVDGCFAGNEGRLTVLGALWVIIWNDDTGGFEKWLRKKVLPLWIVF